MKKEDIINKLNKVASKETSGWLEKAKEREANRDWLAKSAKIAIKILRELRAKKLTQKWLAEELGVSAQYVNKIVKGQENLSLETITKIEAALNITLIKVPVVESSFDYSTFTNDINKAERNKAQTIGYATKKYPKYCKYEPEEENFAA